MPKKLQPEFEIYKQVSATLRYLQKKYQFEWDYDTGSGTRLTIPQAMRVKSIQPECKILDLRVYCNGKTLMLEIKAKSPFKKTGELLTNEHLRLQQLAINRYKQLGFEASFSVGYEETILKIKDFLDKNSY